MSGTSYYAPGQWNFQCDQCGRKFKSGEARLQWDGLRVCGQCLDPRHPQELLRPITDPKPVPWTRPRPPPTYIDTGYQSSHSLNGAPFNFYPID